MLRKIKKNNNFRSWDKGVVIWDILWSASQIESNTGEEDFFNFVNVFSLFRYYLPLEKGGTHHLNKLESPSPKDALCQVWLKLAQWFWRRRFLNFNNVFSPFWIISPWKRAGSFIWTNLKPVHPRMLCAKFGWKRLSGSGEEDF